MTPRDAYDDLIRRWKEASLLASCGTVLGWDQQTHMPPGGTELRSEQLALLSGMVHRSVTDPAIGERLGELDGTDVVADHDAPKAVNVREIRREYDRATKLPASLVEEIARVTSQAQLVWQKARKESDFPSFRPMLERIVELKRQEADAIGYDDVAYDALLDDYEPGATTRQIAELFEQIREPLTKLTADLAGSPKQPDTSVLNRDYPVDRQRIFAESTAAQIGFDFQKGRLDTSTHPMCIDIGPGDVRLTTRYNERDFAQAFFGVLHETGHGLYEQGLDPTHHGTPMGQAVSLGVHESQSRMRENEVGRSRPFWSRTLPVAKSIFPQSLSDVDLDTFHFAINKVEPSLIRVEADEVTYNLHILIRFELETALIAGDLKPADVPGAWNEKYASYLGVTPTSDAEGCLQDIHWSDGLFGYFPTYTLGNLYAAQIFAKADLDLGGVQELICSGDFRPLLDWLREHVHRHGRRYRSADLVTRVTGRPPSPEPLLDSLAAQFRPLYGV